MLEVLPSLPVPEITMASGAGVALAENQTRSLRSNQNTRVLVVPTAMDIDLRSGTESGSGALSFGGVP